MAIANAVNEYLQDHQIQYDLIPHQHAESAAQAALLAHVPMSQTAKAVVLKDGQGHHVMAVLPAMNKLQVHWLSDMLAKDLEMVSENELSSLFEDCETGAVPAFGEAYNMDIIWDDRLLDASDVYVEAGDHEQLIHISRDQFLDLMQDHIHEEISSAW